MAAPDLILASASPRRARLLRALGLNPRVLPARVPEDVAAGESPAAHVARLAEEKARRVSEVLSLESDSDVVVLGADTIVTLEGRILGKPGGEPEALGMVRSLSGRVHEVLTGVFVIRTGDGRTAGAVESTRVRFRAYDEAFARWYAASGEPLDKAGAYSIQERGVLLSEGIEGSWTNVVGLPLERLGELFARVGVDLREMLS